MLRALSGSLIVVCEKMSYMHNDRRRGGGRVEALFNPTLNFFFSFFLSEELEAHSRLFHDKICFSKRG